MAGFLYFVEGSDLNVANIVSKHNLGYALSANRCHSPIKLGATPSGSPGYILCDSSKHSVSPVYQEVKQEWQQVYDLWVGYWKDDPPQPTDLELEKQIPGYEIELGDENKWRVPLVRQYIHDEPPGSQLPHRLKIDKDGTWVVGEVLNRYKTIWDLSIEFFDIWHSTLMAALEEEKDSFIVEHDCPQDTAIKILGANYAITSIEASLLGLLLSDDTAGKIMRAACDCDLAMSWILEAKKNETVVDGSPIEDGVEGYSEDMRQHVPI